VFEEEAAGRFDFDYAFPNHHFSTAGFLDYSSTLEA
jgi:hypothetical protein